MAAGLSPHPHAIRATRVPITANQTGGLAMGLGLGLAGGMAATITSTVFSTKAGAPSPSAHPPAIDRAPGLHHVGGADGP
ncbi:unnamed protein product, partial [Protopolystoma xenopodis]